MRVSAAISSYVCFLPLSLLDILTLGIVYLPPAASATPTVILTRRLAVITAALARILTLRTAKLDQTGRSIGR
jgi:hypothetical protein